MPSNPKPLFKMNLLMQPRLYRHLCLVLVKKLQSANQRASSTHFHASKSKLQTPVQIRTPDPFFSISTDVIARASQSLQGCS
jgi:hypothetical protein